MEAAEHDSTLLPAVPAVLEALAGLSCQFGEFAFLVDDVRRMARKIEATVRKEQETRRRQQKELREMSLTVRQVLEILQPSGALAGVGDGSLWQGNPYMGLPAFSRDNARLFYGRDEMSGELVEQLGERLGAGGMLLVVGVSGAGKSSLLNAGLIPRLERGALGSGSQEWPLRVMRPTDRPLHVLAGILADAAGTVAPEVRKTLAAAPEEVSWLAWQAVTAVLGLNSDAAGVMDDAAGMAQPRLVLIVDHLEELFTVGADGGVGQEEREAFVAALHAVATAPVGPARAPAALVVAAVRSTFLDQLIAYPPLAEALAAGPFTVTAMSEAELRLAITGPAAEAGLSVDPDLAEAVISELRSGQSDGGLGNGALPLVSQAMAVTWEHREGTRLTLRAFQRAGGVANAVNNAAQAVYRSLTALQQDAARVLFTQLTVVTPDGQLAPRRSPRTGLLTQGTGTDAVIDEFARQRLLLLGDNSVEIAHAVLLRAWKQLRDWLEEAQVDLVVYSQIVTDAQAWEGSGHDSSYLYRRGRLAKIEVASAHWADNPSRIPQLPPAPAEFLAASRRAVHRARVRQWGIIGAVAILAAAALTAGGFAWRDAIDTGQQHAIALSLQLAADSLALDPGEPALARQLAVAAWHVSQTDQAGSAMAAMLAEQQEDGAAFEGAAVEAVAFSPGGRLLATADAAGSVRLWNPATGQPVGTPLLAGSADGYAAYAVAFSPDGKLLATAYGNGYVELWNPATGQPVRAIPADTAAGVTQRGVFGVAFSPDGKLLATADAGGYVRLWNPATGQPVGAPFSVIPSVARAVAYSPDGKLLATADGDGYVRLWNPVTGQAAGPPLAADTHGLSEGVLSLAFSPDGRLLATAGADGYVQLWNPATGQLVRTIPADTSGVLRYVYRVAFSPDGKLLATADYNGYLQLWNPATGQPVGAPIAVAATGTLGEGVYDVAFSPDGKLLATADLNGYVRLWNPATSQPASAPLLAGSAAGPFTHSAYAVAFSPDGELLATADSDGYVRLWNPATGQPVGAPIAAAATGTLGEGVYDVAFSPDGELLATAYGNGYVELWNPATGRRVGVELPADPGPGLVGHVVYGVAFSPNGTVLASTAGDGLIQLWRVSLFINPYAALCAEVGPPTKATWAQYAPDEPQQRVCNLAQPRTGRSESSWPNSSSSGHLSVSFLWFLARYGAYRPVLGEPVWRSPDPGARVYPSFQATSALGVLRDD